MLTPREIQILKLVAAGNLNDEIARDLKISPLTVKTHRQRIMEKTGVERRTGYAKLAMRMGLIDPLKWAHTDPLFFVFAAGRV